MLTSVGTLGMFLAVPAALAVGDAYFPQDTTANITIGTTGVNFTINAQSDADSIVVNSNSIAITISAGERLIMGSSDRYIFTNDGSLSTTCSQNSSALDITGTATQRTITITPDGTTCAPVSGGGGGATVSTPIPTPVVVISSPSNTPNPGAALIGAVVSGSGASGTTVVFRRNLRVGSQGADVKALQIYLRLRGYLNVADSDLGWFGKKTKAAVIKWQKSNKISPTSGLFGPLSRAKFNKLNK